MFNFILIVGAFVLFLFSFILLAKDFLTKYKLQNNNPEAKLTKLSGYSFGFSLLALILMVFVSFSYVT